MKDNLTTCPVCDNNLTIVKYKCNHCQTEITGDFKQDSFSKLSQEQRDFIEVFVLKRGSIKAIEKELGISYPTVRNKLDDVAATLGHKVDKDTSKIEILNMVNNGELSSEEAAKLIAEL